MKINKIISKYIQKIFASIFLFSLVLCSCKKVDLPNEQAKLLIGRWDWYKTLDKVYSGTFDISADNDIVFKENGKFIDRDWKVFTAHEEYHVEVGYEPSTGNEINTIKYSRTLPNTFKVSNDTLYMYILVGVRTKIYVRK